jgi:hypothetical protein
MGFGELWLWEGKGGSHCMIRSDQRGSFYPKIITRRVYHHQRSAFAILIVIGRQFLSRHLARKSILNQFLTVSSETWKNERKSFRVLT